MLAPKNTCTHRAVTGVSIRCSVFNKQFIAHLAHAIRYGEIRILAASFSYGILLELEVLDNNDELRPKDTASFDIDFSGSFTKNHSVAVVLKKSRRGNQSRTYDSSYSYGKLHPYVLQTL